MDSKHLQPNWNDPNFNWKKYMELLEAIQSPLLSIPCEDNEKALMLLARSNPIVHMCLVYEQQNNRSRLDTLYSIVFSLVEQLGQTQKIAVEAMGTQYMQIQVSNENYEKLILEYKQPKDEQAPSNQ